MYVTGLFPARVGDTVVYLQAVLASASSAEDRKSFLKKLRAPQIDALAREVHTYSTYILPYIHTYLLAYIHTYIM